MYLGKVEQEQEKIFQIEKPFSGYGFKIVVDSMTGNKMLEHLKLMELNEALSLVGVVASLLHQYKDGTPERPFQSVRLMDLLEIEQHQEGSIKIIQEEYKELEETYNKFTILGYLPLSSDGMAKSFMQDETTTLTLQTSKNVTVDVWSIETPLISGTWKKYNTFDIRQGEKTKSIDVNNTHTLAFPLDALTNSTEFSIKWTNGATCRYKRAEFEFLGLLINDVTYNINGKTIGGYARLAIMDVSQVDEIEIYRDSTSAFSLYLVQDVPVKNMVAVSKHNAGMVDTSQLAIEASAIEQFKRN